LPEVRKFMSHSGDQPQGTVGRTKIISVLTCFNRKALTVSCLGALQAAARCAHVDLATIVVDDASTDGTAAAIRSDYPGVEVIDGSGALFWNRGMYVGFGAALQRRADYYLWLNDDTELVPDALQSLLQQSEQLRKEEGTPVILVGATAERSSGRVTYGGRVRRSRWRRFNFELVWDEKRAVSCEAIEGNCILIPRNVAQHVGNLDPTFEHAMGDTDYGLRARRAGFKSFVAAGIVGYCSDNSIAGTYDDDSLSLRKRWQLLLSRKGLPMRSWLHFTRRHGGLLWPLYFSWPYVRLIWSAVRNIRSRHTSCDRQKKPSTATF
jgi:GT2 family glycosyltransferase